jgi:cobalt-zinc-cadmium efflux system outer membrane protein
VVLTEAEALRLALADPSFNQVLEGRLGVAASDVTAAGQYPNPELGLDHESANGVGDPSETTLVLSQTFDTSGRRRLREQSAQALLEAARLEAEASRLARRYRLLHRFFETLHAQRQGAVLDAWDARIGETERVVQARVRVGEASDYDLRRLRHERALARTRKDELGADLSQTREALLALLGPEGRTYTRVSGRLLPAAPAPLEASSPGLAQRPDLLALRQQETSARLERRVGERAGVPDVTLGLGAKRLADDGGEDWELVLGLSVPLPLFDRGQSAMERGDAQSRIAAGEYQLSLREAQASARGLWEKAVKLQQSAARVESRYVPESRGLADTARAAYQGGELGILELLDAYRGVMETELRALDLALEARLSAIELERVTGGVRP